MRIDHTAIYSQLYERSPRRFRQKLPPIPLVASTIFFTRISRRNKFAAQETSSHHVFSSAHRFPDPLEILARRYAELDMDFL
jgi:hypothetical protein